MNEPGSLRSQLGRPTSPQWPMAATAELESWNEESGDRGIPTWAATCEHWDPYPTRLPATHLFHGNTVPHGADLIAEGAARALLLVDHGNPVFSQTDGLIARVSARDIADITLDARPLVHTGDHFVRFAQVGEGLHFLLSHADHVLYGGKVVFLHVGSEALLQILDDAVPPDHDLGAELHG